MKQTILIDGLYRCQNCSNDVEQIQKFRRWRLCNDCWQAIIGPAQPGYTGPLSDELYHSREKLWQWHSEMEKRYPSKRSWKKTLLPSLAVTDDYYPFCECGSLRQPLLLVSERGLFGGPFHNKCAVCKAKAAVESVFRMAEKIMPDRDDEEWLDLLYKSHYEAFEIGVLPDYWYELKEHKGETHQKDSR